MVQSHRDAADRDASHRGREGGAAGRGRAAALLRRAGWVGERWTTAVSLAVVGLGLGLAAATGGGSGSGGGVAAGGESLSRVNAGVLTGNIMQQAGNQPGEQTRPLNARTSWIGNSFGGNPADHHVQNFIIHMNVKPDGTVYTWSHWDEASQRFGLYRDGRVVGNEDLGANSLKTTDRQGRTWELHVRYLDPNHNEYDFEPVRITCDGREVTFPGLEYPTALAMSNDGLLMVADSGTGSRQQVLFYDVTSVTPGGGEPKLVREFGQRGGIRAGVPGELSPTKFWGIRGIGVDARDNLYVGMSQSGVVLRSLRPDGHLNWQLHSLHFCDFAVPDPKDDAATVWGLQERYSMNYAETTPGREATWTHYTLDRHRYPNDPRGLLFVKEQGEHGLTSPQVVYLQGKRFMFVGGMFASNFINIFRFEDGPGTIMVPSGLIMQWTGPLYRTERKWPPHRPPGTFIWRDRNGNGDYDPDEYEPNTELTRPGPFWVDSAGDIWMAYGFYRYHFQGLDEHGNPIYSGNAITKMNIPRGMKSVSRVWYDRERDILVAAEEGSEMRRLGDIFIYHGYLAGNDHTPVRFRSGAGPEAGSVTAAGDYVFTGGYRERGRIYVNRMSDGAFVGKLVPGDEVGGPDRTGWIDLLTGIAAHRRSDGEYLVFVEENYRGKTLLYRWRPGGGGQR
ncbi:MAG: hypothetical protein ACK4PI_11865 [Tepidisphaerales bacterium]